MTVADQTIDTCSELLRGELAAVETYTQAIEKFGTTAPDDLLQRIRSDHEESVAQLRRLVAEGGVEPPRGSGLWGGFAKAVEATAKLIGKSPALKVLQEGEEYGIAEYRNALEDRGISEDAKEVIRHDLLPRLTDHLVELQRLRDRIT